MGELISVIVITAVGIALAIGLVAWAYSADNTRNRADKEDCVRRGGSVTEYVGGFTRFECVGPKTFK